MLKTLVLAVVLTAGVSTAYSRVFEIRTYTTSQKMERLEALFREHSLALFKKHGFEVIGFWVPQDPPAQQSNVVSHSSIPRRCMAPSRTRSS
jgi:hypothetical protein